MSNPRPQHRPGAALLALLALLAALAVGGLIVLRMRSVATAPNNAWFRTPPDRAGVDFTWNSGHAQRHLFPEIMGGGVCLADFDNDGWVDVYFPQGGWGYDDAARNVLYRNAGDGTFRNASAGSGADHPGYGMGCACGDIDLDGDVDIYVSNVGPNVLLRNDGGMRFTDITEASGTGDDAWGTSVAFADFDRDGLPDLFVTNYVQWSEAEEGTCFTVDGRPDYCSPGRYGPAADVLYRNLGDGRFEDVSRAAGIHAVFGNGLGIVPGDFNGDGRLDYYVANDQMANQLWLQESDGRFVDHALLAGCALNMHGAVEAGMGVAAVDVDEDGDLDLFMSHLRGETNTLYVNEDGYFRDATSESGMGPASLPFTGFGLTFADFNHDGRLDLYIANGRVALDQPIHRSDDPYAEPNLLMTSTGPGRFELVADGNGPATTAVFTSRAVAAGDLDNDLDLDLVVVNRDAPATVLFADAPRGSSVGFRVLNRHGSDAIGAGIEVRCGDTVYRRSISPASGYLSSHDPRVHVGIGKAKTVDDVRVLWPDGGVEAFGTRAVGQWHDLVRGQGRPVEQAGGR